MRSDKNIAELVNRVAAGEMLAAEQLYERFVQAMFHISFQMTQDKMLSEDILQDCFTKSFIKIKTLKVARQYGGWLKRMVINASIDAVKKRKKWEIIDPSVLEDSWASLENESEIEGVDIGKLNKAIAELPEKSKIVFCLFLIEGHTHKTISELLNIIVSTSKSQYRYALKLLRKKLIAISIN